MVKRHSLGSTRTRRVVPATQDRPDPRRPAEKEKRTVNKVLLTGRLTRDPELRSLASGKTVTQFGIATNAYRTNGQEKAEFHNVVAWDRLAEICGQYLGKGQQVAIEGRLQTRSWDDDRGQRHWKTEVVATNVEMLSGRRKKDYDAETAADALVAQAARLGETPAGDSIPASEPIVEGELGDDAAQEVDDEAVNAA
jgi:single stranded DNA-binding protein